MSKTKALAAVKCQINVRTQLLGTEQPKIVISRANVQELVDHLTTIINTGVPLEYEEFLHVLLNPTQLLGRKVSQRWRSG